MDAHVKLRHLAPAEKQQLETLARSRTVATRLVERAKLLLALHRGEKVTAVARALNMSRHNIYNWIRRFNEHGLHDLDDRPRSGRPHTYTPEERAEVLALALTKPADLKLEFACWTLDRLHDYLHGKRGIPISRTRIDELLIAEGLKWRKEETWFGEKVDPEFAKKKGSLKRYTRRLLKKAA
jgi:transposase